MITILSEKLPRILKNKKRLEKKLNIKITNRGKEVTITGTPENEFIAQKTIDAINFGFSIAHSLLIVEENAEFEIINIKDHTKQNNLERIRGRLIGKQGKALKTLSDLTNCYLELNKNQLGVIGEPEHLENAQDAIIAIIKGAKHSNIYKFLEKHRVQEPVDLGLKE